VCVFTARTVSVSPPTARTVCVSSYCQNCLCVSSYCQNCLCVSSYCQNCLCVLLPELSLYLLLTELSVSPPTTRTVSVSPPTARTVSVSPPTARTVSVSPPTTRTVSACLPFPLHLVHCNLARCAAVPVPAHRQSRRLLYYGTLIALSL
jgi:hypothetical protein